MAELGNYDEWKTRGPDEGPVCDTCGEWLRRSVDFAWYCACCENENMSQSELPKGPWSYKKSVPQDGFECFYVEDADGSIVIEVPGPHNQRQEALARDISTIPTLRQHVEQLQAKLRDVVVKPRPEDEVKF